MAYAKIRPKRGTAAQWTAANTILAEGEIGIEVPDEGVGSGYVRIKQGNGSTPWNELPYASGLALEDVLEQLNATNVNYQAVNVSEFVDKDVTVRELYDALPLPCNVTIPVIAPNSKGKFGVSGLPSSTSTGTLTIVKYLVPSVAINGKTDLTECHRLIFWGVTNPAGFYYEAGTGKPSKVTINWRRSVSLEDLERQGTYTGQYVGVAEPLTLDLDDCGNYKAAMVIVTWTSGATQYWTAFIFEGMTLIFGVDSTSPVGSWTFVYSNKLWYGPNRPESIIDISMNETTLRFNFCNKSTSSYYNEEAMISRRLNYVGQLYNYTVISAKEVD